MKGYEVMIKGYGEKVPARRRAGPYPTKEAAEVECKIWEEAAHKDFLEGRIAYFVPEYFVQESGVIP